MQVTCGKEVDLEGEFFTLFMFLYLVCRFITLVKDSKHFFELISAEVTI